MATDRASHARLVQDETTRRTTATHVRYIAYFLGDLRLDKVTMADVNRMTEEMHKNGPISFKLRKDGKPRQRRSSSFTPTAINRILGTLKAALHLAETRASSHPHRRSNSCRATSRGPSCRPRKRSSRPYWRHRRSSSRSDPTFPR